MIKSIYIDILSEYGVSLRSSEALWTELENSYSERNRHYHTLQHLNDLYTQLSEVRPYISNWNVILFTLFYHDVVYKSLRKDNEEQSAMIAAKRMNEIGVLPAEISLCHEQIIATKSHDESKNTDTNYFTDADLSILGRATDQYIEYCQNIRKEYSIYPDFLYNRGRRKVIKHFLSMDRLFKTEAFYSKYEEQARYNLKHELTLL